MIRKFVIKIVLLSYLVLGIFILSTQSIQMQPEKDINGSADKTSRHQDTKVLLTTVEKLNAQIDSIVFLLTIDIPKTDTFLTSIEKRLNEIEADAQAHNASLLIDTLKLSTLRETILYYRSIVHKK